MNRFMWIAFCAAVVLATITGVVAYNIGIEQGAEASGRIAHHHPWGFGFFIPFLVVVFFVAMTRAIFGHSHWHRHGCGYRDLDEWHRQAHEKAPNA